ncbi:MULTISPECIES: hypothetical protein [unclassified Synechococcus]|uniref:hypothetical protein n=1 Tax=unclassified Synechococcus TaxID=2626047 RepID=UPI0039AE9FB7
MSTLHLSSVSGLLIDGQWVRPRPGSVRLVPALIVDDCTPGAEQICTLPGIQQELMTDNVGISQTGVDNPQMLTWMHDSSSRRFFCDPSEVKAYQVEETESITPTPRSVIDLSADHTHLLDG